ncbi:MAG: RsmE family RNA methyltransferase, partial [Bacillota bacterium]|nr:RsmE family RNA methyltransferase [Bacillota bacterium]
MATFFIDKEQILEDEIRISGDLCHHLANVLRFQVGDEIHCSDGEAYCVDGRIIAIDKKELTISVQRRAALCGEAPVFITLIQCLPRGDKMDLVVRQTTELGVGAIIPVESDNSQVRLKNKGAEKSCRWQKVADAAAEQCGRGKIPKVWEPCSLARAFDLLEDGTNIVFCYER